jgi:hypothetical protein
MRVRATREAREPLEIETRAEADVDHRNAAGERGELSAAPTRCDTVGVVHRWTYDGSTFVRTAFESYRVVPQTCSCSSTRAADAI